jgi:2-methylcitrate synthase
VNKKVGGLAGVIAGDTAISTVGKEGITLTYRGYEIGPLAASASFEEIAWLLIHGELPDAKKLKLFQEKLISLREIPETLKQVLERIPANCHPMDVLRTGCSMLGTLEPETEQYQQIEIAERLIATLPGILLYWYQFHQTGKRISTHTNELSTAGHFLNLLHQKTPNETWRRAVDVSLILYAEHEFNASTFAARITASTLSDFYSAIVSGIGTLRGSLHGGANEAAMELISKFKKPEEAEIALLNMLKNHEKIMGFGHRVYKISDPRSDIIKPWSEKLSHDAADGYLFAISNSIEKTMWQEKHLFPNLDFYSATTYHFCQIPNLMFTPLFVLSRVSGWSAHIIEQRRNNRLIRPDATYIGPAARVYTPLTERA